MSGGLTFDLTGNLWVAEQNVPAVSYGPEGPSDLSTISGKNTLLEAGSTLPLQGPGVDPATGNVWVPNGADGSGYLTAFHSGQRGDVAPVATIGYNGKGKAQGFHFPVVVTFDAFGNMFVGDTGTIYVFQPPFTDTSLPVAQWQLQDLAWYSTFDHRGNLYFMSQHAIYVFKGGLKSGGVVSRVITGVPGGDGIAADDKDHLFVSDEYGLDELLTSATTFSPIRHIPNAHLADTISVAVGM